MALATLSIELVAQLANLQAGFDKAGRLAEKSAADIASRFDAVNAGFGKLGVVLGAAFAGSSFTQFIKGTAEGLDKLKDLSDATGSSVENLSALEDIGLRTGASFDTVATSVVKFNKVLAESKAGSADANIFKKLSLDLAELKKQDPAEALRATAAALAKFPDDGNKARVVMQLFGKSVQEVAPFLKDLAEQTELVGKVTAEQAAAGERFNQNLLALQKNSLDLARSLAGPLLTAINEVFAASKAYGGFLPALKDTLLNGDALTQADGLAKVYSGIEAAQKRLAKITEVQNRPGLSDALVTRYKSESKELEKQIELLRNRGQFIISQQPDAKGSTVDQRLGTNSTSIGDVGETAQKKAVSEAQRYLEALQKQGEKTQDLSRFELALADIQNKRLDGITPKLQAQILATAKQIDIDELAAKLRKADAKEQEDEAKAIADARGKAYDEIRARFKQFEEATRTPQEKLNAELKEQAELLRVLGDVYEDTYNRASGAAFSRFDDTFKKIKKETDEFTKNFIQGTQNILADTFENLGRGGFKNLDKQFADLLLRLSAQAAAADLTKRLFGEDGKGIEDIGKRISDSLASIDFSRVADQFSKLIGGLAASIGSLFNSTGGAGGGFASILGSLFAGGFATGGYAGPNKVALVGEQGPELIYTGNRGTTVQPLAVSSQAPAQGGSVTINNYFPESTSRTSVSQIAARTAEAVNRSMARKR